MASRAGLRLSVRFDCYQVVPHFGRVSVRTLTSGVCAVTNEIMVVRVCACVTVFLSVLSVLSVSVGRTRKAHRVCVRDKDLMKYLGGIIVVICGYLAAWSVQILDSTPAGNFSGKLAASNLMSEYVTSEGVQFHICKELSWDYVTESGEHILLINFLGRALQCITN